jgi:predicted nucleic acid-binding Zn ribbon protein
LGTDTVYKWSTIFDTVFASSGTAHSISYVTHDTLKLFVFSTDTLVTYRIDSLKTEIAIRETKIEVLEKESKFVKAVNALKFPLIIALILAVIVVLIPRILKKR